MRAALFAAGALSAACVGSAWAGTQVVQLLVGPTDVVFLAGRSDVTIPELGVYDPSFPIARHGYVIPDFNREQFPQLVTVEAGDVVRLSDPVVGGIHFFNGLGPPFFGPDGDGGGGSYIDPLGGLSGYIGPRGVLTGVFLDDQNPKDLAPPPTLDFSTGAIGQDFQQFSPLLRQVFYIGNGVDEQEPAEFQRFVAPPGATRLYLGIADGFGFVGAPGAYEDNDASVEGGYHIIVGVNSDPVIPPGPTPIPLPAGVWGGLVALGWIGWRRARAG